MGNEYKEYKGLRNVHLLLDARAYDHRYNSNANLSLDLSAMIVNETYDHINLEKITVNNCGLLKNSKDNSKKFKKAKINKKYIIGVFEE